MIKLPYSGRGKQLYQLRKKIWSAGKSGENKNYLNKTTEDDDGGGVGCSSQKKMRKND